jgi:hypothetical protein
MIVNQDGQIINQWPQIDNRTPRKSSRLRQTLRHAMQMANFVAR